MGPIAAPPAAPPPPPPPSDYSDNQSVRSGLSEASSYQNEGPPTPIDTAHQSPFPAITNYGLSPGQEFYPSNKNTAIPNTRYNDNPDNNESSSINNDGTTPLRPSYNVHLRPNTGNTNQELEALLPGSLREIASTLRWMTIISTVTSILWEGFAIPGRILMGTAILDPAKLVLGVYLGVFCMLLLFVEIRSGSPVLRDNFGFLFNPMTRGCVLLMMSSMCFSILKSWWEILLGIAFLMVGFGYIYTYIKYPEYRRWQDYNEALQASSWTDVRQYWMRSENGSRNTEQSALWANPEETWNAVRQTSSEARSLLHNV